MREIKFRMWSGKQNKMVFGARDKENNASWILSVCSVCEIEPMQYTGLNDKNGIEIYEGDVIECINHGKLNGFSTNAEDFTGVIEFYLGCFCIKYKGEYSTLAEWDSSCEIIGNIHANKELLI